MATTQRLISNLLLGFITTIFAFNLEPRIPILKQGISNTYFGFSVAEHRVFIGGRNDSIILVGAPRAQTSQAKNNHSGALLQCPLTTYRNDCSQIEIDPDVQTPLNDELRDDQWLGVFVRSEDQNEGKVLVCAHRYTIKAEKPGENDYRWILGICYSLTNNLDYDNTFEPCRGKPMRQGAEEFGVCQAGSSGLISEDGHFVVGAPGSFTWRGMILSNTLYQGGDRDRRWHNSPYRPDQCPVDKYSYLGFSVISGKFYPDLVSYAVGAPRGNGTGQVVLFKRHISTYFEVQDVLYGDKFASSFGYELAAADLNNDGLSDLIVGAPFFFEKDHGGAIYIYMNKKTEYITANTEPIRILGSKDSRFGISIANLGDLDKDGFQDIAVGAPYEGKGAVYIFHGSKNGINVEPTQVIKSTDLPVSIATFGYSLSGGIDMDKNGYPDLLVGAYEADSVVLLRTRPVINILTEVRDIPKNINPFHASCVVDNKLQLCFSFRPCFKFESSTHHQLESRITMKYKIEAETFHTKKSSRVYFHNSKDKSHIIQSTSDVNLKDAIHYTCHNETVYLKDNTTDYLSSIKFKMTYTIIQREPKMSREGDRLPNIDNYPILDQREASKVFQVDFKKNCGDDDICESNLKLTASYNLSRDIDGLPYISYAVDRSVSIDIILENDRNESAYETVIYIFHPAGVSYTGQISQGKQYVFEKLNSTMMVFHIGNPFAAHDKAVFSVLFKLTGLHSSEKILKMVVLANTTSQEPKQQEPVVLEAKIVISADLKLEGSSSPLQVYYGGKALGESAILNEEQIGEDFIHYYVVKNLGPGVVESFDVNIDWPYEVANEKQYNHGKWLLYLRSYPVVEGYGHCIVDPKRVNPLGIALNESTVRNLSKQKIILRNSQDSDQNNRRQKREERIVRSEQIEEENKIKTVVIMECGRRTARCFKFYCTIKDLAVGSSVNIKIFARLWKATLIEDYPRVESVRIYSNASIDIDSSLEVVQNVLNDHSFAMIKAIPDPTLAVESEGPPIWIIILSVIAGILLVALLVFCLWKLGFFKRNKPDALVSNKHMMDHADL